VALRGNICRVAAAGFVVAAFFAAAACGGEKGPPVETPTATAPGTGTGSSLTLAEAAARVRSQLQGIPQRGFVLGRPNAPIAIIEYAGFDCGACTAVHETVVPEVMEKYIRTGKASLEFRTLAAGEHDLALTLAAHGARPQGHAWDMVQLQYLRSSGDPNSSLAASETTLEHVKALGLDIARWRKDLDRTQWAADIKAALTVYKVAQWGETPVFLVRRVGLDVAYEVISTPTTLGEFDRAIAAALAR
jgi:protein-disulfide isomerase